MRGFICLCVLAMAWAEETDSDFGGEYISLLQTRAVRIMDEESCQVTFFAEAACGGATSLQFVLDAGQSTNAVKTDTVHLAKSYQVQGSNCGDVEVWDDEETGACHVDNEWWNHGGDGACNTLPFDFEDDVGGVTIYSTGGGRTAHCKAEMSVFESNVATLSGDGSLDTCLLGCGRTEADLAGMSEDDKRNTVIVELHNGDMGSVSELQGQSNEQLVASCSLMALGTCLTGHGWRSTEDLAGMSEEDKRNTVIVELNHGGMGSISELQGNSNDALVEACSSVEDVAPACAKWCDSNWKKKCKWLSCTGCSECN